MEEDDVVEKKMITFWKQKVPLTKKLIHSQRKV